MSNIEEYTGKFLKTSSILMIQVMNIGKEENYNKYLVIKNGDIFLVL